MQIQILWTGLCLTMLIGSGSSIRFLCQEPISLTEELSSMNTIVDPRSGLVFHANVTFPGNFELNKW